MSEHTPGPWVNTSEPDARVQRVCGKNAFGPALVAKCETHLANCHDENLANARLIAAAPDMLAALKQLLHECSEAGFGDVSEYNWPKAIADGQAAIERADGSPASAMSEKP